MQQRYTIVNEGAQKRMQSETFDHRKIWTASTDKKLNVNKSGITCTKNNFYVNFHELIHNSPSFDYNLSKITQ